MDKPINTTTFFKYGVRLGIRKSDSQM